MDGPSEPSQETPSNKQKRKPQCQSRNRLREDPERRPDHHHRRREAHAQNSQRRGHGAAPLRHEARQDRRARRRRDRQKQNRQRRDVREAIAEEEGRRPARAATRRLDHARGATQPQDRRHRLSPRTHRPGPVHPALRRQGRGPHPSRRATRFQEHGPGRRRRRLHRRTTNGAAGTDDGTDPKRTGNPARDTPVEPEAKPMPTQRIAWDFVDPEVMEMAANSLAARHPELSWDRLMGDTAWNEQAGRDFADRIIGKAAADPTLRDELDTILRDDYGQGAQTRSRPAGGRPSQAGRRRQRSRKTNRNPHRTKPSRRTRNSRRSTEPTLPSRTAKSRSRSRSGRRRHCSNGSRPGSTRTSPNRRITCHPPRTGTARPARAAERKPQ